jgi:pyruvate dehydrogenase (quinone)
MTQVADVMIEVLIKAGAKRCYGIPGDTLNYFTDAVRRSDLRWVHVRHEEAGAMAAGADALLTGELALCAGSCGPGSLHFINGVWESNRNRAPVVLIASQITRDEQGFDFPQEVDFKAVYSKGTVFCEEIRPPGQARRMTAMAAQAALSRKGVAVLIVPVDVSHAAAPDEPDFAVHRPEPVLRPSDAELDRIAAVLNAGHRIAIYGGSGCAQAHDQVVALAEKLKAPVARTSRAKDFLEHDNPYDVGMTGVFGTKGGYHTLTECDTLLLLGCDFAWRQFYPQRAKIIQIDIDGVHLGRRHTVDIAAVGDIAPTIEALLPRINSRDDRSFLDASLAEARKAEAKLDRRAVAGSGAIHPQYLAETVAAHAASDAVYTADAGTPTVWCLRHVPSTGANRTVITLSHGTMANAMPQALGAQAAYPGRQVISLSGDGGLAMLLGRPAHQRAGEASNQGLRLQQRFAPLRRTRTEGRGSARRVHRSAQSRFFARRRGDRHVGTAGREGRRVRRGRKSMARDTGSCTAGCDRGPRRAGHAAAYRGGSGLRYGALFGQGHSCRPRRRRLGARDGESVPAI